MTASKRGRKVARLQKQLAETQAVLRDLIEMKPDGAELLFLRAEIKAMKEAQTNALSNLFKTVYQDVISDALPEWLPFRFQPVDLSGFSYRSGTVRVTDVDHETKTITVAAAEDE